MSGFVPAASYGLTTVVAPAATALPRGDPMLMSAGSDGGVWFGGAAGRPVKEASELDYITPAGTFQDFPVSDEPGLWPEGLTQDPHGGEWFLTRSGAGRAPALGQISPLGQIALQDLPLPSESELRGLAVGPDGNLWTTETRSSPSRESAILKVSPGGAITAYSAGLGRGASPENITAGPEHALWFIDTTGRIGRIDTTGQIKEFPVGHAIEGAGEVGPPPPIVAASDGSLWFILSPRQIGRMTPSGHVQIFSPPPTFTALPKGSRSEAEAIGGLAALTQGDVLFTRRGGAVVRIDRRGRLRTVTDRLQAATGGIALASDGSVWAGEGASFKREPGGGEVVPAHVARISSAGLLTQYPEPPPCHVPFVLGDGPSRAAEELRRANCEVAAIHRPPGSHSNHLIVVAQSARPGASTEYKAPLRLSLGPKPAPPKTCRAPRYVRVLANSRRLLAWENPMNEADNEESFGELPETYVACVPGHAKHQFFSEESTLESYASLGSPHTAGHFIAFTESSGSHYNSGFQGLTVFDALRGRSVFSEKYPYGEEEPGASVSSLALDSSGDVAWVKHEILWATVEKRRVETGRRDTLEVHDRHGSFVIEAAGTISNLMLAGQLLRWESAGQAHSRPLP